jgi:predicted RNA-binding protein YlqC (UPF0109 family)
VKQLIEYVVQALVSSPEEVEVALSEGPEGLVCKLKVAEEDVGKVIGKDGRIIHALRTLASSCLATSESKLQLDVEGKPSAPSSVASSSSSSSPVSSP